MINNEINSFIEDDIVNILKRIHEYDSVVNLERRCCNCSDIIHVETIYSISKKNGKYIYTCIKPNCIEKRK